MEIKPLFVPQQAGDIGLNLALNFELEDFEREQGFNKPNTPPIIDAKTDADAIFSFLREYFRDSPETIRSYSKEIERLLLWCKHIVRKTISNLTRDDLIEYQKFLQKPEPQDVWCGPKVSRIAKDGSINTAWRPFYKGLSISSVRKTMRILDSFFNYLVHANYLIGNPLAIDRRRKKRDNLNKRLIDRYLELDEIQAVLKALHDYPAEDGQNLYNAARARYIILLLFFSGMRISEASKHTMGNFLQRNECWFLSIVGKGNKPREIPIPDELLEALKIFRKELGLTSPLPLFNEKIPLIPSVDHKTPISARRVDQILHWAFSLGADQLEFTQPRKASKLRQASAHWLRHSYVTYLLNAGVPLQIAKENAGHSDIGTTMLYTHMDQTNRYEVTKKLSLKQKENS